MSPEKWQETISLIKDKFPDYYEEEKQDQVGKDIDGEPVYEIKQIIKFSSPLGRVKLEFVRRPLVLEKKTNYSRRIGGDAAVDYIFSAQEFIYKLNVYQWNEASEDWREMEANNFPLK